MTTMSARAIRQLRWIYHEDRPMERIREHFQYERELAARLKQADREQRRRLYASLYDEMLQRFPDNGMVSHRDDEAFNRRQVANAMALLAPLLGPSTRFLEVGPGTCKTAFEVARHVRSVVAVDVSAEITRNADCPGNFELILSDGTSVPVPPGSIDVAYSNQLMEHLHPDDAAEQLRNLHDALRPGGHYLLRTPNALSGPHDISMFFTERAEGFHLKEYSYEEIAAMLAKAGFGRVWAILGARGHYLPWRVPIGWMIAFERVLRHVPFGGRMAHSTPVRAALGMQLLARK